MGFGDLGAELRDILDAEKDGKDDDDASAACKRPPKDPMTTVFATQEEAAINAFNYFVATEGVAKELTGKIIAVDGGFTVRELLKGDKTSAPISTDVSPDLVAVLHRHGFVQGRDGGEELSYVGHSAAGDMNADTRIFGVMNFALSQLTGRNLIVFLSTPSGAVKKFTGPFSGPIKPTGQLIAPPGCITGGKK